MKYFSWTVGGPYMSGYNRTNPGRFEIEDFKTHALLCDRLLAHYTSTWKNREVYWSARRRSQTHRDLMCVVCDSYDKSKLMIPKYPYNRTPKRPIYETIKRVLKRFCQSTFCKLLRMNGFFQIVPFIRPKPHRLRSFSDAHMCDRTRPWLFPIPL